MGHEREIAGLMTGAGALLLLYQGEYTGGIAILASMMAFFVGEKNGQKSAKKEEA